MRIAISSAQSLADVLIDRVASAAVLASAPTWSTPGKPCRKRRRSDSERLRSAKIAPRSWLPAPVLPATTGERCSNARSKGPPDAPGRGRHSSVSNCHLSNKRRNEPNVVVRATRARATATARARSDRAVRGEGRGGNDEHDRARSAFRGRPAATGDCPPARARALAPHAGEHGRNALRQRALGGEGTGGARCLRRVAPAKGRPRALLRPAARRGARDRRRPRLRARARVHSRRSSDRLSSTRCAASSSELDGAGAGHLPRRGRPQGRPAPDERQQLEVGHPPRRRFRARPAAEPPLPARQLMLDLRGRLRQPDGPARPPTRDPAQQGHLPLPPDVRRTRTSSPTTAGTTPTTCPPRSKAATCTSSATAR